MFPYFDIFLLISFVLGFCCCSSPGTKGEEEKESFFCLNKSKCNETFYIMKRRYWNKNCMNNKNLLKAYKYIN